MTEVKKVQITYKVDPELKEKLLLAAEFAGVKEPEYVRRVLTEAVTEDKTVKAVKELLGQALIIVLACRGRDVSTADAIKLTKELFLTGNFADEVKS